MPTTNLVQKSCQSSGNISRKAFYSYQHNIGQRSVVLFQSKIYRAEILRRGRDYLHLETLLLNLLELEDLYVTLILSFKIWQSLLTSHELKAI